MHSGSTSAHLQKPFPNCLLDSTSVVAVRICNDVVERESHRSIFAKWNQVMWQMSPAQPAFVLGVASPSDSRSTCTLQVRMMSRYDGIACVCVT